MPLHPARLALVLPLAACAAANPELPPAQIDIVRMDSGACFAREISPTAMVTVSRNTLVEAARVDADGRVIQPAIYRRIDTEEIAQTRDDLLFEAVCEERLTEGFVATVQRALAARGLYAAAITGVMDAPTRAAVLRYQRDTLAQGSDVLSVGTARALGLIAVDLEGR